MRDAPSALGTIRQKAIHEADTYLREQYGGVRLSRGAFGPLASSRFREGWQLACATADRVRELHLYVDDQFPFSLPRFLLVDRPPFLTWPHIEENGLLCLVEDTCIAKPEHIEHILATLIKDAYRLIIDSEYGKNESDFQREFHSYWNVQPGISEVVVRSLLHPGGPSRLIRIWRTQAEAVVGESEAEILSWLANFRNRDPGQSATHIGCLLWIDSPLLPREYPQSPADVLRIASRSNLGTSLLGEVAANGTSPFYVILGANSENGPCLAGVRSYRPENFDFRGRHCSRANNGFRPGNVPPVLQAQRLFSANARMEIMQVDRVDGSWIHGRGHDPRQIVLRRKHIVIFGCGSVGGPLAQQLAMAGVGRLTLVDCQRLVWANVGRHPLGAKFVGKFKATALAGFLQENYPHLKIEGHDWTAERFVDEELPRIGPDLLLSATANWPFERALNLCQVAGELCAPVLYSWTERHACAGHALFLPNPIQACLQCGLDLTGTNRKPVTEWSDSGTGMVSEPACGAVFQPYGPVELMGTIGIGASLALDVLLARLHVPTHRIWAAPVSLLREAGGSWTGAWIAGDRHRDRGGFQEDQTWQKDLACSVCGKTEFRTLLPTRLASPVSISSSSQTC